MYFKDIIDFHVLIGVNNQKQAGLSLNKNKFALIKRCI